MSIFISQKAQIGKNVKFSENTIIEDDVTIGNNCQFGYNTVVREGTTIKDYVFVGDNTIIGKQPMRAKMSIFRKKDNLSYTQIGSNCIIGSNTVIYIGSDILSYVFIADLASIRENTKIGDYTIIGRGVTVENYVVIGKRCKLESESYITAYSELEDYVFIAPGVVTSNDNYLGRTEERKKFFKGVTIKKGARIGANATILPGKTIGRDALVGAGSIVTRDVPARKIVIGVPARIIREVPEEQLVENQKFYVG